MISRTQLNQIKDFSLDLDWNQAFGGKSKGNRHLFRIVNLANRIAQKMLLLDMKINLGVVEAGAWLHDSGLAKDIQGNLLCNQDEVKNFLVKSNIAKEEIQEIIHCIEAHDGNVSARTIEAMIVHDADTLEKLGPLGIIRETWKRSRMGWNTERITRHLPGHLEKRKNNLYTNVAQEIAKETNLSISNFFDILYLQLQE